MGLETVFKLSLIMSMIDHLSGPMAKVTAGVDGAATRLQSLNQGFASVAKGGMAAAAIGAQITEAVLEPVKATFATRRAIGELASLGVKDLGVVEDAATRFAGTWAGTTKDEFIAAAYDIKSGIASLSDTGIAEYTSLAGITAKATKSTVAEMTSLFATGYGIYKDYYGQMSDLEFGEMFAGGIAASVRQFKTTGSQMAQSISVLGASATTANVPLEEQLSILGMLQGTMGGSEAGTKYKAFLRSAAKGGEALGLTFTDANNQLLSMPEILDILRGRFGETMDAAEKMELQKAFGDTEAVALIDLMYSKVGDLQGNIVSMYDTLGQGSGTAMEMATAINSMEPDQYQILTQQVDNLKQSIGASLLPTVSDLLSQAQPVITKMTDWTSRNQELVKVIMLVVMTLGGLLTVVGGGAAIIGGFGFAVTGAAGYLIKFGGLLRKMPGLARGAIGALKTFGLNILTMGKQAIMTAVTALPGLISSVWAFTAALWANPITWIVAAILALIAVVILLWRNWDSVTAFLQNAWNACCQGVAAGIEWLKNGFNNIVNWITEKIQMFKDCGRKIVETLVGGILSVARKPIDAVKGIFDKVRNLLPFSDAKEGPLSELTLSGSRVMTTMAEGIDKAGNAPTKAVEHGLRKVDTRLEQPLQAPGYITGKTKQRSQAQEAEGSNRQGAYIDKLYLQADINKIKELPLLLKLISEIEDYANSNGLAPIAEGST